MKGYIAVVIRDPRVSGGVRSYNALPFDRLVMLLSALACAQEFRALISGQVTDSSGASIPGRHREGDQPRHQRQSHHQRARPTDAMSWRRFPPGRIRWLRRVRLQETHARRHQPGGGRPRDRSTSRWRSARSAENVTVTAELAAIDTDRSVLSQLMDNKGVSELPLNGRQVFMLTQLSAGIDLHPAAVRRQRLSAARAPGTPTAA